MSIEQLRPIDPFASPYSSKSQLLGQTSMSDMAAALKAFQLSGSIFDRYQLNAVLIPYIGELVDITGTATKALWTPDEPGVPGYKPGWSMKPLIHLEGREHPLEVVGPYVLLHSCPKTVEIATCSPDEYPRLAKQKGLQIGLSIPLENIVAIEPNPGANPNWW